MRKIQAARVHILIQDKNIDSELNFNPQSTDLLKK